MSAIEQPVFPADLAAMLGIEVKTLSRWIKEGKVPKEDVRLTAKTRYWHRSTLVKKKLIEAAPQAASNSESPVSH